MLEQDETGWGSDLGFPKKVMVLAPSDEEEDVYYRANVLQVDRKRKLVTLEYTESQGYGRHKIFLLPLDHKRIWRFTCDANRWEKLFADARQRQRRCKHSGGWRPKPGAQRIAYSELPTHELAKAATKEAAAAARDTSKHQRRRQRQHQRKQRKHQQSQHGNNSNSLRQKLVCLASLIGSACGIQPSSSSRHPAAADPSTAGKAGSSGRELCSQDSSSNDSDSEDSNSSGSSDEGSESDSSGSSSSHGDVADEDAAHAGGDSVLLHLRNVDGGNATRGGQAATAVTAGNDSGPADEAPAADSRNATATHSTAATVIAGESEPHAAAPAVGVGGRKRRAAADGVKAASLAAVLNAGNSGNAKRVRFTASSSTAAATPDTAHPVVNVSAHLSRQQQQQHGQPCLDTPAIAAKTAAGCSVSSIMIDSFQLHILSVRPSRGACQLYIAQCQLIQYATKCCRLSRDTVREAIRSASARAGLVEASAAQLELLKQAGADMHRNARYLLRLDTAAHVCDRRDMPSAAAALRAAQLNMTTAAAASGGGPLAAAATASTQQQQCQRGSVEEQRGVETAGRPTLRCIVIDGFTLHLLQHQHKDSSCTYFVAASQLSRYARQCCGLYCKAIYAMRRRLEASITVCTNAQQQLLLSAKAVQRSRHGHGNAHLLSLPLAVEICRKCGLFTAAEALETLRQQPATAAAVFHDTAAANACEEDSRHQHHPQPPADGQIDSRPPEIQHQEAAMQPLNAPCQSDLLTALAAAVAAAKAAVVTPDCAASLAANPAAAQPAAVRPIRIDGYQLHLLLASSDSGSLKYFLAQHQLVNLIQQVSGWRYAVVNKIDEACLEAELAVITASIDQQQLLLSYGVLEELCECRLVPLVAAASVLAHFGMDDASQALLAVLGQQVVDQRGHGVLQTAHQSLNQAGGQSLDQAGGKGDIQSSDQGADQSGNQSSHRASSQGVVEGVDQASGQHFVDQVVDQAAHQVMDQMVDHSVNQGVEQSVVEDVDDEVGDHGALLGVALGAVDFPAAPGLGQQQGQQQRQQHLQQQQQQQQQQEEEHKEGESEASDHSRQQKQPLDPLAVPQQTYQSGRPDVTTAAAAASVLQCPAALPAQMTSACISQQQQQQQQQYSEFHANKDKSRQGQRPPQQLPNDTLTNQLQQEDAMADASASIKQVAEHRVAAVHIETPASAAPASVPGSLEGPQVTDLGEPSGLQQRQDSGAGGECSAQAAAGDKQHNTAVAAAGTAEATARAASTAPVAAAAPTQPTTTAEMNSPSPSALPQTPAAATVHVVPAAALTCIQLPGDVELCVLRAADNTAWLLYEHFQRYAVNSPDTLLRTRPEFDRMFTEIAQYSKHTVRTRRATAAEQRLLATFGQLAAGSRSTKLVLLEVAAATFEQVTLFEAAIVLMTALPSPAASALAQARPLSGPASSRTVSPSLILDSQSADSQVAGQTPPAAVSRSQPSQMQGGADHPSSSIQQEVVQQTQDTPAQQTNSSLANVALHMPQDCNRQKQHRDEVAPHVGDAAPGLSLSQSVLLSHTVQHREQEPKEQLQEAAQEQQQQEDEPVDLTEADASLKAAGTIGVRTSLRLSSPRRPLAAVHVDPGFSVLAEDCIDLTADD